MLNLFQHLKRSRNEFGMTERKEKMSEIPQFSEEPKNPLGGDFDETVLSPEFQDELKTESKETKYDKEFELTPETEAKIMEKVVAIGQQRDLISHGTSAPFLDMTAEFGLVAFNPKFRERWKGYGEFIERRKNLRPHGLMMRTGANNQGSQSVSFFDPYNTIEVLEAIENEQDFFLYAIPIDIHLLHNIPEEAWGRATELTEGFSDELKMHIMSLLPCEIEEINSVYIPLKSKKSGMKAIVKGKFKVDNNALRFLESNINEPKKELLRSAINATVASFQTDQKQVENINEDLKVNTEGQAYSEGRFITVHSTIQDITEFSHESFIRLYAKVSTNKNTHDATLNLFKQLKKAYEQYFDSDEEFKNKLASLKDEASIIHKLAGEAWSSYGSILVQLNDNDIKIGQVVRNESGIIGYPTPSETFYESRISPRIMVGIVPVMSDAEFSEQQNRIAETINWPQGIDRQHQEEKLNEHISTEKAIKFAQRLEIPVYDKEGDLLWPKKMSYEEVKQFVADRDAEKKEMDSGSESGMTEITEI